jgi:hypothetical protein
LFLGGLSYVLMKLIKRIKHNKLAAPVAALPPADDAVDDFMCMMRADGWSITTRGVTVIGRRIS